MPAGGHDAFAFDLVDECEGDRRARVVLHCSSPSPRGGGVGGDGRRALGRDGNKQTSPSTAGAAAAAAGTTTTTRGGKKRYRVENAPPGWTFETTKLGEIDGRTGREARDVSYFAPGEPGTPLNNIPAVESKLGRCKYCACCLCFSVPRVF